MNPEPTVTQTEDGAQMVPFPAQCRFCGVVLNCMVDPAGVAEKPSRSAISFTAAMLRELATCNRCADVRRMGWRVESAYKKNADKLSIARACGKDKAVEGDIRAGFTRTTQFWLDYLCKQYRIGELYDDSVIDSLVTKPQHYPHVTRMLRQMVEKAAREAWAAK